jgi:hypothetical protein
MPNVVALVTGASRGAGRRIVLELGAAGVRFHGYQRNAAASFSHPLRNIAHLLFLRLRQWNVAWPPYVWLASRTLTQVEDLTAQLGYQVDTPVVRDRLSRLLAHPDQRFFVADVGGRVVGWVHVTTCEYVETAARWFVSGRALAAPRRTGSTSGWNTKISRLSTRSRSLLIWPKAI